MTLRILWGEADASAGPNVWGTSETASDGGVPFGLLAESNPIAPAGHGGECAYIAAHLTITHSMSATLRVTPIVDGQTDPATGAPLARAFEAAGLPVVLAGVAPTFALPQCAAPVDGGEPPRRTVTVPVPLMRRMTVDGVERSRWRPRGGTIALRIESVGELGAGELRIDGVELEYEVLRRPRAAGAVVALGAG